MLPIEIEKGKGGSTNQLHREASIVPESHEFKYNHVFNTLDPPMDSFVHLYYNLTKLDTRYVLINKRSKNNTPYYLLKEPNFLQCSGKQRKGKKNIAGERGSFIQYRL